MTQIVEASFESSLDIEHSNPSESLSSKLAKLIAREMIYKYKISREEGRKKLEEKRYKVFFAHELLLCPTALEFRKVFSEIEIAQSFQPQLMVGEIVESGLEKFLNKLGLVKCTKVYFKIIDSHIVAGSPDYVDNLDNPSVVVDVKFKRASPQPLEHHVARMKVYLFLTDAEEGILLYISPEGIKDYVVREPFSRSDISMLISQNNSPRFEWQCKYCPFSKFCSRSL